MSKKLEDIYKLFDGKLIGNLKMRIEVCETILNMKNSEISFITKNCWFMSSFDDAWSFTFKGNDLKGQYLIFISDDLLSQDKKTDSLFNCT